MTAQRGDCRGQAQTSVRSAWQLDRYLEGRRVDGGPHRKAGTQPPPHGGVASRAFEVEQSQLGHLGMGVTRWPLVTNR